MGNVVVSFVCAEPALVLHGIKKHVAKGIDRLYMLYDKKDDIWGKLSRENLKTIEEAVGKLIEIVKIGVNPRNYDELFEVMYDVVSREVAQGSRVYIDITSLTRIGVVVSVVIATLFGASIYTVIPEYYFDPDRIRLEGAKESYIEALRRRGGVDVLEIPIPTQPVRQLSEEEKRVLVSIYRMGGTISSLRQLLQALGREATNKERADISYRLKVLERKGCIEKKRDKVLTVSLTRFGAALARVLSKEESSEV